jgi:Domain of unknown function (DUF1918)
MRSRAGLSGHATVPNVPVIWAGQPVPAPPIPAKLEGKAGSGGNPGTLAEAGIGAVMRANVGDLLILPGRESRVGQVIRVVGQDGAPPYVVKWQSDGHIAMVTPSQYARIVPASHRASPGLTAGSAG